MVIDPFKPLPYSTKPVVITDANASANGAIYLSSLFIATLHGEIPLDLQTSRPVFVQDSAFAGVDPGTGEFGLIQSSYGGAQAHLTNILFDSELLGLPGSNKARAYNCPWSVVDFTADAVLSRGCAGYRVRNAPGSPVPKRVAFSRIEQQNVDGVQDDGTGARKRGNVWEDGNPNQSQRQSQAFVLEGLKGCAATLDSVKVTNTPGLTTAEDLVTLRDCDGVTFNDLLLDGHYRGRMDDSSARYFNGKATFGPATHDNTDDHGVYTDGRGYVDSGCSVILGDGGSVANVTFNSPVILEMYVAFAVESPVKGVRIKGGTFLRSGFTPDGRLLIPQTGYLFQVPEWAKSAAVAGSNSIDGMVLGYDSYPVGDGTRHATTSIDTAALKAAGFTIGKVSFVAPTLARVQQARDDIAKVWASKGKVPGLLTS